jgi:hypothetical protein
VRSGVIEYGTTPKIVLNMYAYVLLVEKKGKDATRGKKVSEFRECIQIGDDVQPHSRTC